MKRLVGFSRYVALAADAKNVQLATLVRWATALGEHIAVELSRPDNAPITDVNAQWGAGGSRCWTG